MSDEAGITFALVAVALAPLAYWLIGPDEGRRPSGSNSVFRLLIQVTYFWCIVAAIYAAVS